MDFADIKPADIAATYQVAPDPMFPGGWVDLTESEPRTRVRVGDDAQPVNVVVLKTGAIVADGDIEHDTTFEG